MILYHRHTQITSHNLQAPNPILSILPKQKFKHPLNCIKLKDKIKNKI